MKRKTKVTMNDIARAAGVSQATVSLVLNQSRNIKLSDDTRQRVINVATELGYDRLPAVHAPRNQEEIALLVSSMQSFDPFIDAISQAREAAWRNETLLTVYDYGDDVELALNIIRQLDKRNCIGIILASPVTNVVDMTAFQDCTRIPLVLLNQRDPGSPLLPSFIPDDYANAFQVTRHLIACGATRIAHITGESWMEASRQRLAGYQAALQQAGLACDDGLVRQTNWQFSESFTATASLLELAERPDAIFCASDWLAIGCYQALAVNGVRIPQDMLLAGYDDQKISEQLTPPLTSIQLPYSELGRLAVEYLCNQEDAATHVTLAGRLKVRASSLVRGKHHARIGLLATRRQPRGEATHVQLQLVPVRVEKIERCPLAFVLLPDGDARLLEPLRERFKIRFRHGKRVVGVVALLRRHVLARLVVRQTDPQIAAGEIGPGIPAGVQRQPQQLVPEGDAFLQVADREGQVVE